MRCKKPLVILLTVFMLIGLSSIPAMAERFADLYLGLTFTQDDEVDYSSGGVSQKFDISFDASGIVGYRMGYFFERAPFVGLALEVSYTNLEYADKEEISLLALSPLLMLRVPIIKSDKYPRGEWLPFFAAGPAVFMSQIDSPNIDANSTDVGLDLRLGVKKMVARNWALLLEYRYAGFSPEYEENQAGSTTKAEMDLNLHGILFGVTYNF
jgi:opacity protein-like surface antigen